jgi:hypothetical protein
VTALLRTESGWRPRYLLKEVGTPLLS